MEKYAYLFVYILGVGSGVALFCILFMLLKWKEPDPKYGMTPNGTRWSPTTPEEINATVQEKAECRARENRRIEKWWGAKTEEERTRFLKDNPTGVSIPGGPWSTAAPPPPKL